MPRYKLTIEYDGTPFVGWQIQDNGLSIQSCLADAVHAFAGERVVPSGAGRTDAGVHATGQVAHLDLARDWPVETVRNALNYHLKPNPISVLSVVSVAPTFDARFCATERHYLFRLLDRPSPAAIDRHRVWRVPAPLDADTMNHAAQALVGHHDFTTFRSANCQAKSPIKTLDKLDVLRVGTEVHVVTAARSFMHNQVRSMVGSLKLVGEGKWTPQDLADALRSADRRRCGPVAPPDGLYLTGVSYP